MFENFCALLLRLYPAGFRRAYGSEAVQLMRDRARHERGVFPRIRLLIDLALDLGAISLHGWQPGKPVLAPIDGPPHFDIIDSHGPRPVALAAGMLTSILMFAAFTLLFQPKPLRDASALLGELFGSEMPGAGSNHFARQADAGDPEAHPVGQSPAFEVISIKPARSADPRSMRMRVLPNGDLHASAVPVHVLLRYAYDVPVNPSPRLSGLPGWRETYDIEARAPAGAVPAGLPEREKRGRIQLMIRGLLADRFKLVMRVEQKTMPVYALTVASGGPNLQKSTIEEKDCILDTGTPESCHHFIAGRGHPLDARAVNMDDLAQYIENWADLPVVNRTGISGLFDVKTEGWMPMRLPPPPPGNAPAAGFDDLPTIFTVLRTLGLELKKQEATVPVYTVERIERPAGE